MTTVSQGVSKVPALSSYLIVVCSRKLHCSLYVSFTSFKIGIQYFNICLNFQVADDFRAML